MLCQSRTAVELWFLRVSWMPQTRSTYRLWYHVITHDLYTYPVMWRARRGNKLIGNKGSLSG